MPSKCEIIPDLSGEVVRFVCRGLNENEDWVGQNITLGIKLNHELIAGIIINDIRAGIDCWLTIYANNKRWCSKRVLRAVFDVVFDFLKCRRVSVMLDFQNKQSRKLVEKLGFQKEGVLRGFQNNGNDALIYSMLKQECQWRTKNNE